MNLNKGDFTLFENNSEEQIQYFGTEDSPISVGVLVDLSGGMKNRGSTPCVKPSINFQHR